VDGAFGVVELGEVVLDGDELDELPLMPDELELDDGVELDEGVVLDVPPELEPDLLKWASHSAREIDPSLFVSTAEKLGAEELLALEPPLLDMDGLEDEPLVELDGVVLEDDPLADGVVDCEDEVDEEPVAAGDDEEDEDCATASVDSANSTAAVMVPTVLSMRFLLGDWTAPLRKQ
jgi:hypothetical protein